MGEGGASETLCRWWRKARQVWAGRGGGDEPQNSSRKRKRGLGLGRVCKGGTARLLCPGGAKWALGVGKRVLRVSSINSIRDAHNERSPNPPAPPWPIVNSPFPPITLPHPGGNAVLGYLLGGAIVGPYALGLVSDVESVKHLAEIGVVLLLFNIGLELSLDRLQSMAKFVFGMGTAQVGTGTGGEG